MQVRMQGPTRGKAGASWERPKQEGRTGRRRAYLGMNSLLRADPNVSRDVLNSPGVESLSETVDLR